jgi:hypothetical protein
VLVDVSKSDKNCFLNKRNEGRKNSRSEAAKDEE